MKRQPDSGENANNSNVPGLNRELDEVRGRILSRSPFPSINDAFAERTKAMESNENACGATIATVPGILVTLAGKFTESQQTGHQGDNQKVEDSKPKPQYKKANQDLNCTAKFFPSCCEFQDLSSGRTIGKAWECDGLYYYEDSAMENGQANAASIGPKLEPRAIKCVFLGEDTNSPPAEPPKQQLRVYSRTMPRNIHEALKNPKSREAVMEEMKALQKNNTWKLLIYQVVNIQWAANGKTNSTRILLSLAANSDWPLYQLDIKNAFLNRELVEEVYMELPPGFFDDQGDDIDGMEKLKRVLAIEFEVKDLDLLRYFLGMEVARTT
ncbi:hypothetical protein CK203_055129 [Vitis vinifera]|uniref:Reverse transcriptase Ty1/copia-type domain-containing protein n=1 Tax=Vitis vinifera TaxID=29760 RepID=A0A438GMY8_VITVI|nr:hypothetical protein CK203_055129 [Vitis vinifera]